MAQQMTVTMIDDLTGETGEDIREVQFAWMGWQYEIDLSAANRTKWDELLSELATVARRTGRYIPTKHDSRRGGSSPDREKNQAIRQWAAARGIKVSERGRIPAEIVDAYRQEHS